MTTFNTVVSHPTVADGSMRARHWATNMREAVDAGRLTVSVPEGQATINSTAVDLSVLTAIALREVYENTNPTSLDDFLSFTSAGYSSKLAQKAAAGDDKLPANLPARVMTADQYLAAIISAASRAIDLAAIVGPLLNMEKPTQKQLADAMLGILETVWTAEKQDIYIQMVTEEKQAAERFAALTALGFENISPAGKHLTALLDGANMKAVRELPEHGYMLVSSTQDAQTYKLRVFFQEKPAIETK